MKNGAWNKMGSKGKAAAAGGNDSGKGKEDSSDDGFAFLTLEKETALAGRVLADPNHLVLDSGATAGMVPRRDLFTIYHSIPPSSKNVIMGRGDTLQAIGIGTITIKGEEGEVLNVKGVLHVPGLAANLLSCSQIARQEYICMFTMGGCTVRKDGPVVMEAKLDKGLYIVPVCVPHVERAHGVEAEEAACSTHRRNVEQLMANFLHLRMGHAGRQKLVENVKKGELKGVEIKEGGGQPSKCPDCTTGKLPRTSFPTSTTRASAPLELVHTDVCGPMQTSDTKKARKYFITSLKEGEVLNVKGVLHVLGLAANLLSCSQLARQRYICTFTMEGCTVCKGGAVVMEANSDKDLYLVPFCVPQVERAHGVEAKEAACSTHWRNAEQVTEKLLHLRMGHLGRQQLVEYVKKGEPKGVEIKEGGGQPSKCPDCTTEKLPRTSFPTSPAPLELVERAHGVEAKEATCSTHWRNVEQVTANLLHLRMGHAGRQQLVGYVKKGELKAVEIKEGGGQPSKYPDCTTRKLRMTSFPTSTTRASAPLELVHTDVCGPMQTPDTEKGRKYFITFLEEEEVLNVKGVLHVPRLAANLLLCSQLARQGYICTFTMGGCTIRKGGAVVMEVKLEKGLYLVPVCVPQVERARGVEVEEAACSTH
ncbi:unnamed protein product [Closterium sp. NIES-54]